MTTDTGEHNKETQEERDADEPSFRHVLPSYLPRTLLLSLLVHLSPLLLMLHFEPQLSPIELDTEWFGEFEKLQSVGHGNNIQVQLQMPEEPTPEKEPEPKIQDEPKEEQKPEEKFEEKEPKKPEEKQLVKKKEKIAKKKKEPKPEPKKEVKPKPEEKKQEAITKVTEKAQEESEPAPTPEPEKPTTDPKKNLDNTVASNLPGLEYSGPSNIPMLQNYAPGNARMTALIRLDVVRDTPYHKPAQKLFAAIPDYRIILDQSSTDPIRDFDAIFTASANPTYLQETFLVVKHSLGKEKIKQQLDARFAEPMEWTTYRGNAVRPIVPASSAYQDPRKILIPNADTALVVRPEWLSELTKNQDDDSPLRSPSEDDAIPALSMLDSLEHIHDAAPDDTMVMVSFQRWSFMLPGYGRLPRFEAVKLALTTPAKPKLTIDLQFKTPAQAASFAAKCPTMKKKLVGAIPGASFMKIDTYINRLSCAHTENYVTVRGEYTQKEFLRAIGLATPFLPRPPALEDLPQPPARSAQQPTTPEITSADMGNTKDMGTAPDMTHAPPTLHDMGTALDMTDTPAKRTENAADMSAPVDAGTTKTKPATQPQPKEKEPAQHQPDMGADDDAGIQP